MNKPQAPLPEDYKVTRSDLALPDFSDSGIGWVLFLVAAIVCAELWSASTISLGDWKRHAVGYVIAGVLLVIPYSIPSAILSFILCAITERVLPRVWPRYGRVSRFRNASKRYAAELRAYEAWLLRQAVQFWQALSGVAFERELAALFRQTGYVVRTTPATGDGGVDLILEKAGKRIVVQCKAHASKVGISTARELVASMIDFKAHEGIIAATSGVTKPVLEYVKDKNIHVYDINTILALQRRLDGSRFAAQGSGDHFA